MDDLEKRLKKLKGLDDDTLKNRHTNLNPSAKHMYETNSKKWLLGNTKPKSKQDEVDDLLLESYDQNNLKLMSEAQNLMNRHKKLNPNSYSGIDKKKLEQEEQKMQQKQEVFSVGDDLDFDNDNEISSILSEVNDQIKLESMGLQTESVLERESKEEEEERKREEAEWKKMKEKKKKIEERKRKKKKTLAGFFGFKKKKARRTYDYDDSDSEDSDSED